MKKLVFTLVAALAAASLHASAVQWASSTAAKMLDFAGLNGNGVYTAGGSNMRNNGTWAYVVAIVDGSDNNYLDSSGTISFGSTGKINTTLQTTTALTATETYYYTITITGSPAGLTGLESDAWDYSSATMTATLTGSFSAKTGTSQIQDQATSWTVSGAIPKATPDPSPSGVPEPTSGLLMLVGLGALALRRRR